MELIAKEFDLHIFRGSFNGSEIRCFADTQSNEIYISLDDLPFVSGITPDHMTREEFNKLKQTLIQTLQTTVH